MIQCNIKISKKDLDLIKKISLRRGEGYSDFIRMAVRKELAILGFLSKEESKALGVDIK
mgnify:CR=1 FL=1|jgi:hypothetical protein